MPKNVVMKWQIEKLQNIAKQVGEIKMFRKNNTIVANVNSNHKGILPYGMTTTFFCYGSI